MAQPSHHPVVLGPGERDGHADLGEPGEGVGAHRGVDLGEAGRGRVGADQVARRGGGHPVGVGDEHRHRGAPQRRHARDRPGERRRQPRGRARGGAPRRQRLRPQPGRPDRDDAARPARERELERDPAAERVAGDVEVARSPARPARPRSPPRAAPASAPRPRSGGEPPKPGRSTAITSRSPASSGVTGAHTRRSAPSGCRSTSGGPSRCGRARDRRRRGGRAHAPGTEPTSRSATSTTGLLGFAATLRSGSRAGDSGRHCGLANSACESPIRCSAKPASQ